MYSRSSVSPLPTPVCMVELRRQIMSMTWESRSNVHFLLKMMLVEPLFMLETCNLQNTRSAYKVHEIGRHVSSP